MPSFLDRKEEGKVFIYLLYVLQYMKKKSNLFMQVLAMLILYIPSWSQVLAFRQDLW